MNILQNYKTNGSAKQISPDKKQIISKAVKRAVDEYKETYKLLAAE